MGTPFQENYFDSDPSGDLRLLFCGNRIRTFGHKYGPYKLSTYLLCYVEEGSAEFHFGGRTVQLCSGTFYVVYPHCGLWYVTDPEIPWSIHWVVAGGAQLSKLLEKLGFSPENPILPIRQAERTELIFRRLFSCSNSADLSGRMTCFSLLYELFALLAEERAGTDGNPHIRRALDYISAHYTERLSIPDIAEHLHLSSNYFTKLFKQETGVTPVQYIASLRYEKSAHLLRHTDMPVSEIAQAVGFSDTLYFSRFFHGFAGSSPTAFRKADR